MDSRFLFRDRRLTERHLEVEEVKDSLAKLQTSHAKIIDELKQKDVQHQQQAQQMKQLTQSHFEARTALEKERTAHDATRTLIDVGAQNKESELQRLREIIGEDEDLHDLLAERYERTSTIVTSNLAFNEWGEAFPNKLLGAATLDRLRHRAYQLILDGKTFRAPRPQNRPHKQPGGQTPTSAE